MVRARLRVTPPADRWTRDVSCEFPDTAFCLSGMAVDEVDAVEVVTLRGGRIGPAIDAVRAHPEVEASTVFDRQPAAAMLQLQTDPSVVMTAANHVGVPVRYPLEITDGKLFLEVLSTHERISALGDEFDSLDLAFEVVNVQRDHETCRVLTERQQEVLRAAVEHGYYETPRRCSLTELAEELGIVKSACSGTLHRAVAALVEHHLGNGSLPGDFEPSSREATPEIEN